MRDPGDHMLDEDEELQAKADAAHAEWVADTKKAKMDKCDAHDFNVPQKQRPLVKDRIDGMLKNRVACAHEWLATRLLGVQTGTFEGERHLYSTARILLSYDLDVTTVMSLMQVRVPHWDSKALLDIVKKADTVGTSKRHTYTSLQDLAMKLERDFQSGGVPLPDKPSVMKPTNPKDAVGIRKPRFYSGMSGHVERLVGIGMLEGAMKYGRHNYRPAAVRSSVYYDATREHLACFWEGEDVDPDSGLPHLIKAICSLFVIADAYITGNMVDDRPPRTVNPRALADQYQPLIDKLFERYPDPKEAYTNLNSAVDSLVKPTE